MNDLLDEFFICDLLHCMKNICLCDGIALHEQIGLGCDDLPACLLLLAINACMLIFNVVS